MGAKGKEGREKGRETREGGGEGEYVGGRVGGPSLPKNTPAFFFFFPAGDRSNPRP